MDGHVSGSDRGSDVETDPLAGLDCDGSNDGDGLLRSPDPESGLQGSSAAAMGCTSLTSSQFYTANLAPNSSIH